MPKTYTVKQVAVALGFSTNTVYKYLDEGKIKATRLGSEGRFRIPESEVTRLLGERQAVTPPSPSEALSGVERAKEGSTEDNTLSLLNRVANPDLFDVFLVLTAVFVGLTEFLYPLSYQLLSVDPYRSLVLITKILLILAGPTLIAVNIFIPAKKTAHHLLSRLPLAAGFAVLAFINTITNQYLNVAPLSILAIFSLISILWHKHPIFRFLTFLYLVSLTSAFALVYQPQPILFADLRYFISSTPGLFIVLASAATTIAFVICFYASRVSRPIFTFCLWAISFFFLLVSLSKLTDQSWTKAIVYLCIAAFCFLQPISEHIESLSHFTRRQVLIAFIWMLCIVALGVLAVYTIQSSYRRSILSTVNQNSLAAARLIDNFITDSVRTIGSLSQSPQVAPSNLTDFLKESYLANSTLRRLLIVSSATGEIIASYPPSPADLLPNLAGSPLADQPPTTLLSYLSPPPTQDSSPAIYISSSINADKLTGVLVGIIDTVKLEDQLDDLLSSSSSTYTLIDSRNRSLLPPDSSAPPSIPGQSYPRVGYSSAGVLSFLSSSPIKPYQLTILVDQPYAQSFRTASIVSFSVFLVTLLSGIGGLLGAVYFSSRKP